MSINYPFESYFVIVGLRGTGKSLFLNAISDSECCQVGSYAEGCTKNNQLVTFVYKSNRFFGIDTPGLDYCMDNYEEKSKFLNHILIEHPKISTIIIIKKYNDLRLPLSMPNTLNIFF